MNDRIEELEAKYIPRERDSLFHYLCSVVTALALFAWFPIFVFASEQWKNWLIFGAWAVGAIATCFPLRAYFRLNRISRSPEGLPIDAAGPVYIRLMIPRQALRKRYPWLVPLLVLSYLLAAAGFLGIAVYAANFAN